MLGRLAPTVLVVLVAISSAASAATPFVLTTAEDVTLEGDLRAELRGGSLQIAGEGVSLEGEVRGFTGLLSIYTWRAAAASYVAPVDPPVGVAPGAHVARQIEDAVVENLTLVDADLALVFRAERADATFVAGEGSTLEVAGHLVDAGRPTWLDRDVGGGSFLPVATPNPYRAPDRVDFAWSAGWTFVGVSTFDARLPEERFPRFDAPELRATGPVRFDMHTGNLTVHQGAETRTVPLGNRSDSPGVRVFRLAVLEGEVADARIPLTRYWGASAPEVRFAIDGTARWVGARGRIGDAAPFEDRNVTAVGTFAWTATTAAGAVPGLPVRYAGEGDGVFRVEGVPVAPPTAAPAGPVATASLAAILLGLLAVAWKFLPAMYTRIAPTDLLDHARRRAMYEAVLARPGIHKRELHRLVGGAWGPFTFHLHLLADAGYLRSEDRGRYTLLFAAGATTAPTDPVIPNPIARRVYAEVPVDGAVAFSALRERVGVSRQLLAYHLRGLESRGLVHVVPDGPLRKSVARARP